MNKMTWSAEPGKATGGGQSSTYLPTYLPVLRIKYPLLTAVMQGGHCTCPFGALQRTAACLNHSILSFDHVLQIGAELNGQLQKITKCESCVASKGTASILSQIIPRLISYYEAAHSNDATSADTPTHQRGASSGLSGPARAPSHPGHLSAQPPSPGCCQSVPCDMKLGRLSIRGSEARMLVEVVLVDACLDLNEQIQEWKMAADESIDLAQVGKEPVDAIIEHCFERLAKLIGLLQFGGLYSAQS